MGAACINIGSQNDAVLSVPFDMPVSYIMSNASEDPLSRMRNSANIYCNTVSPLRTGDADVATLSVSVWARLKSTNLNAIRYSVVPTETLVQTLSGGAQSKARLDNGLRGFWNAIESLPIIGSIADGVGNVIGEAGLGIIGLVDPSHVDEVEDRLTGIGIISGKGKDKGKGGNVLGAFEKAKDSPKKAEKRSCARTEIRVAAGCLVNSSSNV